MSDRDPTDPSPEEDRQAQSLARALERDHDDGDVPDDALEVAALLRYSRDGGALDPARSRAILEEVLETARVPAAPAKRPWRALRWLVPAVAAAIVLLVVLRGRRPKGSALPAPTAALIRAEERAASGTAEDRATLALRMQDYRGAMYATLRGHYR